MPLRCQDLRLRPNADYQKASAVQKLTDFGVVLMSSGNRVSIISTSMQANDRLSAPTIPA